MQFEYQRKKKREHGDLPTTQNKRQSPLLSDAEIGASPDHAIAKEGTPVVMARHLYQTSVAEAAHTRAKQSVAQLEQALEESERSRDRLKQNLAQARENEETTRLHFLALVKQCASLLENV